MMHSGFSEIMNDTKIFKLTYQKNVWNMNKKLCFSLMRSIVIGVGSRGCIICELWYTRYLIFSSKYWKT